MKTNFIDEFEYAKLKLNDKLNKIRWKTIRCWSIY